jgi:hypothetical protein
MMPMAIAPIARLIATLTTDERHAMREHLSSRIAGFFDARNELVAADEGAERQFDELASTLRLLGPKRGEVPANGIAFRGFAWWLTPELLGQLRAEADVRRTEPLDRVDHFLGCGGRIADQLTVSPTLLRFIETHVGSIRPTGVASYLFYERKGLGIRPHVDTDIFSVNLMIMLRHDVLSMERSATVVFPSSTSAEQHRLEVGEVMILYGSSVVHTRSLLAAGEKVHLLTIGYRIPDE